MLDDVTARGSRQAPFRLVAADRWSGDFGPGVRCRLFLSGQPGPLLLLSGRRLSALEDGWLAGPVGGRQRGGDRLAAAISLRLGRLVLVPGNACAGVGPGDDLGARQGRPIYLSARHRTVSGAGSGRRSWPPTGRGGNGCSPRLPPRPWRHWSPVRCAKRRCGETTKPCGARRWLATHTMPKPNSPWPRRWPTVGCPTKRSPSIFAPRRIRSTPLRFAIWG